MSEELKKGIPLFETTGEIVKRTKEDKERYDKDFEKILKEAGVLKENQSINLWEGYLWLRRACCKFIDVGPIKSSLTKI